MQIMPIVALWEVVKPANKSKWQHLLDALGLSESSHRRIVRQAVQVLVKVGWHLKTDGIGANSNHRMSIPMSKYYTKFLLLLISYLVCARLLADDDGVIPYIYKH